MKTSKRSNVVGRRLPWLLGAAAVAGTGTVVLKRRNGGERPGLNGYRSAVSQGGSELRGSDRARTALGVIRLANGALALLAPSVYTKPFELDRKSAGPVAYVLRLFGVRTVYLGLSLLGGGEHASELRRAPYIHASDTAAAIFAGVKGHLPPKAAATGAVMSGVNTVLAVRARGSR